MTSFKYIFYCKLQAIAKHQTKLMYMFSKILVHFCNQPIFRPLFTVAPSDAKYDSFFPITSETPLLQKVSRNIYIKTSEV